MGIFINAFRSQGVQRQLQQAQKYAQLSGQPNGDPQQLERDLAGLQQGNGDQLNGQNRTVPRILSALANWYRPDHGYLEGRVGVVEAAFAAEHVRYLMAHVERIHAHARVPAVWNHLLRWWLAGVLSRYWGKAWV